MKSKQLSICDLVEKLVGVVSAVSVLLFLIRFSPLCKFVVPACYVFDILFVMLLFLRLKLYGAVEYLGTWQNLVDLLSAVPAVVLFSRYSSLFQFITPLGCFCLFRLLNIIQFAKHSALAKKHFQHICFIIILIETAAILGANVLFRSFFNAPLIEKYTAEYERFPSNPEYLMKDDENVILVYKNGTIQSRKGFIRDKKTHFAICNSASEYLVKMKFSKESIVSDSKINAPKCGIIVKSPELLTTFNWLMLLLLLPAIIMFAVILLRDILSKDAMRLAVAADAMQSGNFAAFDEELKAVEQDGKDEIELLYQSIDSARHNFSPKTEVPEAVELAEITEPLEAETATTTEAETEAAAPLDAAPETVASAVPVEAEPATAVESVEVAPEIEPAEIAEAAPLEAEAVAPVELVEAAAPADDEAEPAEVVAEIAEPVELAEAQPLEAEPETAVAKTIEEAEPEIELAEIAEAASLETESPAELAQETVVAEPAEVIEEAAPLVEHEPPRSGGLLALALKKRTAL